MVNNIEQEFLQAVTAYSDALFRHCYFRVYNKEAAQDLVQEIFCRCWSSYIVGGKKVANLRALLYRIANNLIIDQSRKKVALPLNDDIIETLPAPGDNMIAPVENTFLNDRLTKLLSVLQEDYRQVVVMRYLDELLPREIAEILNLSENVVSVRINRALKKLRQLVGGVEDIL